MDIDLSKIQIISIHAPRVGRDAFAPSVPDMFPYFNPRAPCGARPWRYEPGLILRYFNPRAPCGARHCYRPLSRFGGTISIHAPRVGRDLFFLKKVLTNLGISIHAPRVGRDFWQPNLARSAEIFQSTRPVWGATKVPLCFAESSVFQSTRPVWGATNLTKIVYTIIMISIHAPRVGRDLAKDVKNEQDSKFQSTRPVWGATTVGIADTIGLSNFNPRAPCGARRCYR